MLHHAEPFIPGLTYSSLATGKSARNFIALSGEAFCVASALHIFNEMWRWEMQETPERNPCGLLVVGDFSSHLAPPRDVQLSWSIRSPIIAPRVQQAIASH